MLFPAGPLTHQTKGNLMKNRIIGATFLSWLLGMAVSASGQSLLSTLNNTAQGAWGIGTNGTVVAQQFTTGSQSEDIGSISVDIWASPGSGTAFTVSLYDDVSGQPGTMLSNGLLSGPGAPAGSGISLYDATGLTLAANSTYWIVFNNTDGPEVLISNVASSSSTTSAGWTLDATGFYYASSPGPYNTGYTGLATPLFSIDSPSSVPEPSAGAFLLLAGLIPVARRLASAK
jgi:hypothetical protein